MTIYTAVRMKDGVHYIASNTTQCTKQLQAMKCTRLLQANKLHIDSENGSIAICKLLNLNADMKRAKSDNERQTAAAVRRRGLNPPRCRRRSLPDGFVLYLKRDIV